MSNGAILPEVVAKHTFCVFCVVLEPPRLRAVAPVEVVSHRGVVVVEEYQVWLWLQVARQSLQVVAAASQWLSVEGQFIQRGAGAVI